MTKKRIPRISLVILLVSFAIALSASVQMTMFRFESSTFITDKFQIVGTHTVIVPKYSKYNTIELYNERTKEKIYVRLPNDCQTYPKNKILDLTLRQDSQQILFWKVITYYMPFGTVCMK
jgi:hypothetical protein